MSTAATEIALTAAITDTDTGAVHDLYDAIARGIARGGAAGVLDALTDLGITADMPARLAESEYAVGELEAFKELTSEYETELDDLHGNVRALAAQFTKEAADARKASDYDDPTVSTSAEEAESAGAAEALADAADRLRGLV